MVSMFCMLTPQTSKPTLSSSTVEVNSFLLIRKKERGKETLAAVSKTTAQLLQLFLFPKWFVCVAFSLFCYSFCKQALWMTAFVFMT